jgi:HSP20 family protein
MYTTYNLFNDVLNLRDVFDDFFRRVPSSTSRRIEFPYVNLYEKEDEIVIKAILPCVKSEDINVQLIDNGLVIEGERKIDYADNPYIRKERVFGKFKKSIRLPYDVDSNKISATLKDGIMTIKLVKSEAAKPKKIAIK